jgi:hypothetical protein
MRSPEYYLSFLNALESDSEVIALFQRIQVDAWREGMTNACDIGSRAEIIRIRDCADHFQYENPP